MTLNADIVQELVLSEILTCNANVEYLSDATDHTTFWAEVSIKSYEDL
jgi:hypothetical protein